MQTVEYVDGERIIQIGPIRKLIQQHELLLADERISRIITQRFSRDDLDHAIRRAVRGDVGGDDE